jgi:hypothetical protein
MLLLHEGIYGRPYEIVALKIKVFHTVGKFQRCKPVHELLLAFQVLYIYYYVTKLCTQQTEVIQNNENPNVCNLRESEARHRKYRRLHFGGSQAYDYSSE